MGRLIEGKWVDDVQWSDKDGRFRREQSGFREQVRDAPDARFAPEPGRYLLYVALACPWAHRTLIAHELKGLGKAIGVSVVDPYMGQGGWRFSDRPGCTPDPLVGAQFLHEIYTRAKPDYTGRVTTPVLFDRKENTIVNNESREILRMFSTQFDKLAEHPIDLLPDDLHTAVDEAIDAIYEPINNGVYRAGFAEAQAPYDEAITALFAALDHWDEVLGRQRYMCGDRLTEADICLFTTLLRFDSVYHTHFKCNVRRIVDYPNLSGYLRDIYQTGGIAKTCNSSHIKEHYYRSHPRINPAGIVARGPDLRLDAPHGRDAIGRTASSTRAAAKPSEHRLPPIDEAAPALDVELVGGGRFSVHARTPKTFTLIIAYRGFHCGACGKYLQQFEALADEYHERGVELVAVSMDDRPRAEKSRAEWNLDKVLLGYGMTEDVARAWGLYISAAIKREEPPRFSEPGVFLVRPGSRLYYAAVTSMTFGRPEPKEVLDYIDFVTEKTYPARGTAT